MGRSSVGRLAHPPLPAARHSRLIGVRRTCQFRSWDSSVVWVWGCVFGGGDHQLCRGRRQRQARRRPSRGLRHRCRTQTATRPAHIGRHQQGGLGCVVALQTRQCVSFYDGPAPLWTSRRTQVRPLPPRPPSGARPTPPCSLCWHWWGRHALPWSCQCGSGSRRREGPAGRTAKAEPPTGSRALPTDEYKNKFKCSCRPRVLLRARGGEPAGHLQVMLLQGPPV